MLFRHYILTRFNIPIWRADKNGAPTLTDEWLQHRFELFDKFCLPSIMAQTKKDFLWVVLFDRNTPQQWKERIENYKSQCQQFHPVFVKHEAGRLFLRVFQEVIADDLGKEQKNGTTYDAVLSTYFDNDDALRTSFVEDLHRDADSLSLREPLFISYRRGIQYFTDMNIATAVNYRNNHFLSLLEPVIEDKVPHTVFGFGSHSSLSVFEGCQVKIIKNNYPAWAEVVHHDNVFNDVLVRRWPSLVTRRSTMRDDFAIDLSLSEHSRKIYLTNFFPRFLKANGRFLRDKFSTKKK
ncbi:MAG: hypothetical protein IKX33_07610 [Prevotella sp.]|nr:hypothetical protein [Prevotella sp.]